MRTLTIILTAAFVFLLTQQLTAADDRPGRGEFGASQVVVAGEIGCFPDGEAGFNSVFVAVEAALDVIPYTRFDHSSLGTAVDRSEECSDLIPELAEQLPHSICEIGNNAAARDPSIEAVRFVCTGRSDVVISAVGELAKAVARLGQP